MPERWLPCPSHPAYEVSDLGRVRRAKPGRGARAGRVLAAGRNGYGYLTVCIEGRSRYVHVLVAEAFLGPIPPGGEVDHRNLDRADARLANLAVYPSRFAHSARHRRGGRRGRRGPAEPNVLVACGCRCGERILRFAPDGRRRSFLRGHNLRAARRASRG